MIFFSSRFPSLSTSWEGGHASDGNSKIAFCMGPGWCWDHRSACAARGGGHHHQITVVTVDGSDVELWSGEGGREGPRNRHASDDER